MPCSRSDMPASTRNQYAAYYRCSKAKREGKAACEVHTNYRADELEREVFEYNGFRAVREPQTQVRLRR